MSLAFNDTANLRGIVQTYEEEIEQDSGFVSGNTVRLKQFVNRANLALDDFIALALQSSGTWQFDDSNQTDYPIMTTNLVSGQRDYTFTTDEGGNLVLDIYKVLVADASGIFSEITPIDVQSSADTAGFTDGRNTTGTPTRYDKTANGFFLDPIPSYSYALGLKVYINREASYFTHTDTTKKPGVPGIFHRYFAIRPAEDYARKHLPKKYEGLRLERLELEARAKEYFGSRTRDERKGLGITQQNNH